MPSQRAPLGLRLLALLAWLPAATSVSATEAARLDLERYSELLARHTRQTDDTAGTRVDYRALGRSADWRRLVDELDGVEPEALASREEKLAFWINAYNILAIQTVLAHYPVESIRDAGSFLWPVWRREAGRVGGRPVTLHEIEHEILRPMGEPRIHAAIVCASTSCPSLRRVPFRAEALDAQLDAATRRWLTSESKGARLDRTRQRITLSPILDWFEEDFEASGGVLEFVARHLPESDATWIRRHRRELEIRYFDYDWSLNEVHSQAAS